VALPSISKVGKFVRHERQLPGELVGEAEGLQLAASRLIFDGRSSSRSKQAY